MVQKDGKNSLSAIVVLGVGNEMRGDDAAGLMVARNLQGLEGQGIYAYETLTMPEAFAHRAMSHQPDIILTIDAADMGLTPGDFRLVPKDSILMDVITTHTLPLRFLIEFFASNGYTAVLIGIQPKSLELGTEVSDDVRVGVEAICTLIKKGEIDGFKTL